MQRCMSCASLHVGQGMTLVIPGHVHAIRTRRTFRWPIYGGWQGSCVRRGRTFESRAFVLILPVHHMPFPSFLFVLSSHPPRRTFLAFCVSPCCPALFITPARPCYSVLDLHARCASSGRRGGIRVELPTSTTACFWRLSTLESRRTFSTGSRVALQKRSLHSLEASTGEVQTLMM
ncbi:uncharacterized protein C8Q71DRAFT_761321 [Rhodofomes roseus]|uniref:Uncharacterized protein n=1 Tax=Rhodofomes roseus TaxID=34475 RepID=A0ABQ8KFT0_9APHY|nr:uncharacterized protein C8Q71DRAFT_761321 [Rhodofomes roseus]KAH9836235.1 hypothetical protein C8Q71DRAFT_761321 [Rhodofomes roseus]